MASFEWKKLNSNVALEDTRKKLYQKYFCSAKYFCPGGRIIRHSESTLLEHLQESIQHRREYHRIYNHGGSWRALREKNELIDAQQLLDFSLLKDRCKETVKFRVEEPYVTIYTETETELYEIASNDLAKWLQQLTVVHTPANDNIIPILNSNAILVKTDIGYKYKFVCKDGSCMNKHSIYSYLDNLGDQVKVSKTVWLTLERQGSYIWGVWFYANDPNIASMLNIIEPNFVTNIHDVVVT